MLWICSCRDKETKLSACSSNNIFHPSLYGNIWECRKMTAVQQVQDVFQRMSASKQHEIYIAKHKLPCPITSCYLINGLNWVTDFSPPSSHSAFSATFPQGSEDLLITGSEVHYQCVHCQPSWLGLEEGHTDLIRRSWVLITSRAERLWFHQCRRAQVVLTNTVDCEGSDTARVEWCSTTPDLIFEALFGEQKKWIIWW